MPTTRVKGFVNMSPYPGHLYNHEMYSSPISIGADPMSVTGVHDWAVPWCTGPDFDRRHLRLVFQDPGIAHPNKTVEYFIWQETRNDGDYIRFTLFPHQQQVLTGDYWTGYKPGARPLARNRDGWAYPVYRDSDVVITLDERLWVIAYHVGS